MRDEFNIHVNNLTDCSIRKFCYIYSTMNILQHSNISHKMYNCVLCNYSSAITASNELTVGII